jgi:hypothetical protein
MKQNRPQTTSKHEKERKQTEDPARSRTTMIGAEKKMPSLNSNRWCGGIATSSSHHHHPWLHEEENGFGSEGRSKSRSGFVERG